MHENLGMRLVPPVYIACTCTCDNWILLCKFVNCTVFPVLFFPVLVEDPWEDCLFGKLDERFVSHVLYHCMNLM